LIGATVNHYENTSKDRTKIAEENRSLRKRNKRDKRRE
jgi:hypothetical protein